MCADSCMLPQDVLKWVVSSPLQQIPTAGDLCNVRITATWEERLWTSGLSDSWRSTIHTTAPWWSHQLWTITLDGTRQNPWQWAEKNSTSMCFDNVWHVYILHDDPMILHWLHWLELLGLSSIATGSWTGGAEHFTFRLQPKAALANFASAIRCSVCRDGTTNFWIIGRC